MCVLNRATQHNQCPCRFSTPVLKDTSSVEITPQPLLYNALLGSKQVQYMVSTTQSVKLTAEVYNTLVNKKTTLRELLSPLFWAHILKIIVGATANINRAEFSLTLLELQSRFGDTPLKFQVVCPQLSPKRDCGPKRVNNSINSRAIRKCMYSRRP